MGDEDAVEVWIGKGEKLPAQTERPDQEASEALQLVEPAQLQNGKALLEFLADEAPPGARLYVGEMKNQSFMWRRIRETMQNIPRVDSNTRVLVFCLPTGAWDVRDVTFELRDAMAVIPRDVTFELRDAMAVPIRPVPPYFELPDFVAQPPAQCFPVPRGLFYKLPDQNRDKIFRPSATNENCVNIVPFVKKLIDPPVAGGSKKNFIHLWDTLISDMMAFFFVVDAWIKVRDGAGEGSSGIKRPDFIARFANLYALFRGEEKGSDTKGDPDLEIIDKMEWTYGTSIPYILGYYAREYIVTFCSLRDVDGSKYRNDIRTFNLMIAKDRVDLFIACLNMSRILATLRDLCISSKAEPDFTEYERPNGKLVRIYGRKVLKVYMHNQQFEMVLNMYSELASKDDPCPYAEVMLHFNEKEHSLVFERAYGSKPRSLKELKECLSCICKALVWLHDRGLMHRDMRWENVAQCEGHWILLDFDEASRSPSQGPHLLNQESHAPEMSTGQHTTSVDIWSVGFLLSTTNINLTPDLVELMNRCLGPEQLRPNARQCLKLFSA